MERHLRTYLLRAGLVFLGSWAVFAVLRHLLDRSVPDFFHTSPDPVGLGASDAWVVLAAYLIWGGALWWAGTDPFRRRWVLNASTVLVVLITAGALFDMFRAFGEERSPLIPDYAYAMVRWPFAIKAALLVAGTIVSQVLRYRGAWRAAIILQAALVAFSFLFAGFQSYIGLAFVH